jgi:hypothetical protein
MNKKQLKLLVKECVLEFIKENANFKSVSANTTNQVIEVDGSTLSISNFTNNTINVTATKTAGEAIFIDLR